MMRIFQLAFWVVLRLIRQCKCSSGPSREVGCPDKDWWKEGRDKPQRQLGQFRYFPCYTAQMRRQSRKPKGWPTEAHLLGSGEAESFSIVLTDTPLLGNLAYCLA